jgi:hypothetical protein
MVVILCVLVAMVAVGFILRGLSDFDISDRYVEQIAFDHHNDRLSGTLILPDITHRGPIALLVHGDGPQDRFANDGYLPLINAFLDQGIGIYTWDKPGIGSSTGNWLDQSMPDRASEAATALGTLTNAHPDYRGKIGFIGFSQAGWVVPKASVLAPDTAFIVMIGGAVNWQDQAAFYMRQRLMANGVSEVEIARQIRESRSRDHIVFAPDANYETYLAKSGDPAPVSKDRFAFIKRNITADARTNLARLTIPTLALWGADDLNVDAVSDAAIYRDILNGKNGETKITIVADATHGLLKSDLFNYARPDDMPISRQLLYLAMGRYAYAPDVIEQMTTWMQKVTSNPDR